MKNNEKTVDIKKLNTFLQKNKKIDWLTTNLLNETQKNKLNWKGLEDDQEALKLVKAYQRLVKLLGENDTKTIKAFLKKNIHSAIQVAAMPKHSFLEKCSDIFKNDTEKAEEIHKKAISIRSSLLLEYMNILQNKEPHTKNVATL